MSKRSPLYGSCGLTVGGALAADSDVARAGICASSNRAPDR
jgi:hypothetical protein